MKNVLFLFLMLAYVQVYCSTTDTQLLSECHNSENAVLEDPIKLKVYGKGGIVSSGDKNTVCPEQSTSVCTTVEIHSPVADDDELTGGPGVITIDNKTYDIKNLRAKNVLRENARKAHTTGSNFTFQFVNR